MGFPSCSGASAFASIPRRSDDSAIKASSIRPDLATLEEHRNVGKSRKNAALQRSSGRCARSWCNAACSTRVIALPSKPTHHLPPPVGWRYAIRSLCVSTGNAFADHGFACDATAVTSHGMRHALAVAARAGCAPPWGGGHAGRRGCGSAPCWRDQRPAGQADGSDGEHPANDRNEARTDGPAWRCTASRTAPGPSASAPPAALHARFTPHDPRRCFSMPARVVIFPSAGAIAHARIDGGLHGERSPRSWVRRGYAVRRFRAPVPFPPSRLIEFP